MILCAIFQHRARFYVYQLGREKEGEEDLKGASPHAIAMLLHIAMAMHATSGSDIAIPGPRPFM
eukprot:313854-Rhodomonas_salina.5